MFSFTIAHVTPVYVKHLGAKQWDTCFYVERQELADLLAHWSDRRDQVDPAFAAWLDRQVPPYQADDLLHFAGYTQPGESADPLLGPSGQATLTDGFLDFGPAKRLLQELDREPTYDWQAAVYGTYRGEDRFGRPE